MEASLSIIKVNAVRLLSFTPMALIAEFWLAGAISTSPRPGC
jgi:hypothetical protein